MTPILNSLMGSPREVSVSHCGPPARGGPAVLKDSRPDGGRVLLRFGRGCRCGWSDECGSRYVLRLPPDEGELPACGGDVLPPLDPLGDGDAEALQDPAELPHAGLRGRPEP